MSSDNSNAEEVREEKKHVKSFKEYYANPEFKEKHKKYMVQRVECDCGKSITRCNLTTHKRTKLHERRLQTKTKIDEDRMRIFCEMMIKQKMLYKKNSKITDESEEENDE